MKSYDGDRKPDFLIITGDSLTLYFNFIEIESPAKKFFSSSKPLKLSAEFDEAVSQVLQWKTFTEQHYREFCDQLINPSC